MSRVHLQSIKLRNFRLFSSLSWEPGSGINIILGDNGAGKSSVLEAIYFLSRYRSFRTAKPQEIIKHHSTQGQDPAPQAQIRALIAGKNPPPHNIAEHIIKLNAQGRRAVSIDDAEQTPKQQAEKRLALVFVAPHNANLVDVAPAERRAFLDALVLHIRPAYATVHRNYQRCLRQRNKILFDLKFSRKKGDYEGQLAHWDRQFAQYGEEIENWRQEVLQGLLEAIHPVLADLGLAEAQIEYERGWKRGSLADALRRSYKADLQYGFSTCGCHRADFCIMVRGLPAVQILSLGQQKMLSLAFFCAASLLLRRHKGSAPVLLFDDVVAQLDQQNRSLLLDYLLQEGNQALITATDAANMLKWAKTKEQSSWEISSKRITATGRLTAV